MPSVAHKLYMLNVAMLSVIMINVLAPSAAPYVDPTIGLLDLALKASQR